MIDKLEVRVPRSVPYTREFAKLYRDLAWDDARRTMNGLPKRLRTSPYYEAVVDLREFGHEAILHNFARLGKNGDHKVELVQTGKMGFSWMIHEVAEIFDIDPETLAVMRIDLTADVPDIPVSWFLTHCRVQYKRWAADIGQVVYGPEYSEMGMKVVQTFYLGKRPNVFRIYDKVAEYHHQYKQLLRNVSPDAEIPTFEEVYGRSLTSVLTRVERQLAAGRVPPSVDAVKKLRSAASFNPFDRLKIIDGYELEPQPHKYRSDVYERGMEVRRLVLDQGLQRARYLINEQSKGNADRILRTTADFIPSNGYRLTSDELFERYQESVTRQLRA